MDDSDKDRIKRMVENYGVDGVLVGMMAAILTIEADMTKGQYSRATIDQFILSRSLLGDVLERIS